MIELKSPSQLEGIKNASRLLVDVLTGLKKMVVPGIITEQLDNWARKKILDSGADCAFLGYKGFPKTICTSVNEQIVHGIPGKRILKNGDIISIDVGVRLDGYFSDAAVTVAVGNIANMAARLIEVTRKALLDAIGYAVCGGRLSDISCAVERCAVDNGLNVVREFVGHGIGLNLHEDPPVPNFGRSGAGVRLKEGMVLAIEPMINAGGPGVEILDDGWTAVTQDGSLSAHFEHTVAITKNGPEVFTEGIE
ncbi:MAG: type I methionyl aminopeptidase [Candidatus Omnitrophica bacterium]|nr:type I methionyl aminopeptidase [Candidatus Omnitrophota bacterium]